MSVVYFIQAGDGGPIKIGVTNDAAKRLRGLQTGCPVPVRLLATQPGDVQREAELHSVFDAHRQHGEWFFPASELLDYVGTLEPAPAKASLCKLGVGHTPGAPFTLDNLRHEKRWTLEQLSGALGLKKSFLCQVIKGKFGLGARAALLAEQLSDGRIYAGDLNADVAATDLHRGYVHRMSSRREPPVASG